jgi:hypothetical protein
VVPTVLSRPVQRTRRDEEAVMPRNLPANASTDQLRAQAKELRRAAAGGNPGAAARIREALPDADPGQLILRDAQLVIAREYGFDGWHELIRKVGTRDVDERELHRWFGVELNNGTWDLIENVVTPESPAGDREQTLYGAYAALYHWAQVGTVANQCRGEYLIHAAAVAVGRPELALHHALRCAEHAAVRPDLMTPFDLAGSAEALARGYAAAGDLDTAATHLARARELAAALDDGDRAYFDTRFATGPWYGLAV